MTNDPVIVTLNVRLPRDREFEVREEAPASDLSGGDDVTALALIGRAARSAVVRYADDVQHVLDLFESLQRAVADAGIAPARWCPRCGHAPHEAGCGADISSPSDGVTATRYAFGVCMCVGAEGTDEQLRRDAGKLHRVELALKGGSVTGAGDPADLVGALISAVYVIAQHAGVDTGAADTIWQITSQLQARVSGPNPAAVRVERDALARIVTAARAALESAGYPADDAGDEQLSSAVQRLATDRLALTSAVEAARNRAEIAEGEVARYRAELAEAGMPTGSGGVRKLAQQLASSTADRRGLQRQLDGHRRWSDAFDAIRGAGEQLPLELRDRAGTLSVRVVPNESGGGVAIHLHPGSAGDAGVLLDSYQSRRLFLAGVRSMYPPAVTE